MADEEDRAHVQDKIWTAIKKKREILSFTAAGMEPEIMQ